MATSTARRAAIGLGFALLLAGFTATAGEPPRAAKPAKAATVSKPASKSAPKVSRTADLAARRSIAGGPTADDALLGAESPELSALRTSEIDLFTPAAPATGSPWPSELPVILPQGGQPRVSASGVPSSESARAPATDTASELSWLSQLQLPDLPVRWDERLVRYLQFFRDDPRGHALFANLFRHSGRFRDMMRRALRRKSMPDDLVWVSMMESGFDPAARSICGAAGLWQFMPETGRVYGLGIDRWLDQRYSPELATLAATELLSDLHRRFGSWELALAAYNMGHAGLASVVRRYNTNDFWALARTEGTLPWETTLYVPKILAAAVIAHNLTAFGFGDLVIDVPIETDRVDVPPGTPLSLVAQAAACDPKEIESLNPELRAARTPPVGEGDERYAVRVPAGKGTQTLLAIARMHSYQLPLDRYVVRYGETLDQIASAHRTSLQRLVEINAIAPGEAMRGGTVLLVPRVEPSSAAKVTEGPAPAGPKQSVVVPSEIFAYPDRRRVFYRVLAGDTLTEIASALRVSADELRRWNDLDAGARLQEGMTLQAFVPPEATLSNILVVPEGEVRVLPVGSEEFFSSLAQQGKFKRVTVAAKAGDTIETIGRRFQVSARTMERINRRGRADMLRTGETVVVYVPSSIPASNLPNMTGATASNAPAPNGPLPAAPVPDLLP